MRVLLAKLGKQAIACDETNRLKLRHFLKSIISCCLYGVNTVRLEWGLVPLEYFPLTSPDSSDTLNDMLVFQMLDMLLDGTGIYLEFLAKFFS